MKELTRDIIINSGKLLAGSIGIYKFNNGVYETVYVSEAIPKALGMSPEEYHAKTSANAMEGMCIPDRANVEEANRRSLKDGSETSLYYRVYQKTRGFTWVHAKSKWIGELEGCPVIAVWFVNTSIESDMYENIVNNSERSIYVVDCDTYEVLYANYAAYAGKAHFADLAIGTPCYDLLKGRCEPCEDCFMKTMKQHEMLDIVRRNDKTETWEHLTGQMTSWCGHNAFIQYIDDITESYMLTDELEKSQHRYQVAVEGADIGVWEYNIKEHIITSPSQSFKKYGIRGDIKNVPDSILHLFPDDQHKKLISMFGRLSAGEERVEDSFWMKWGPDMPLKCAHVVYTVTRDENGEPETAYGIGIDVTAQEREKEKYDKARKQMSVVHSDSVASFHLNITMNWCGEGQSGMDDLLKQQEPGTADGYFSEFAKRIADEDIKAEFINRFTRENLIKKFAEGKLTETFEYPTIHKDGIRHWRQLKLYMLQNPETGDLEAYTYGIDIDEQKNNEHLLKTVSRHSYNFLAFVDLKMDMIITGGDTSNDKYDNYSNEKYTPAMETALKKLIPEKRLHEALGVHSIENIMKQLEDKSDFQYSCETKDGRRLNWIFTYADNSHEIVLIMRSDITEAMHQEKIRAEKLSMAMKEAEHANRMKTEFLSNLSHDMRTPLNAVLGYANFAAGENDPAEKNNYISKIISAGNILLTLINDTLDLSKIESGEIVLKPEPVHCSELINRVIAAVQPELEKRQIRLIVDSSRAVMSDVNADAVRVQEVFINLLSNAIKFSHDGSEVYLIIECVKFESDCIHDRITVRDNGCGISPDFIDRIFEPFTQERTEETADVGGSGLGLSIVKRIVDLMGGTIEVKSEPGKGTEFVVYLDFERTYEDILDSDSMGNNDAVLEGRRILLCEDNAMNREIACKMLEAQGIITEYAKNGIEGLETFRASEQGYFDAVLMDIRMPGMDGCSAAKAIRSLDREDAKTVPVIAMSADAYDDDIIRCREAGMNGHVSKPIDPAKLYDTLAAEIKKSKSN